MQMIAASDRRRLISCPSNSTEIGSPNGAWRVTFTILPGMNPSTAIRPARSHAVETSSIFAVAPTCNLSSVLFKFLCRNLRSSKSRVNK